MTLEQTLARVERFIKASGLKPSTVSRKVFLDGKRLDRLKDTGNCTLGLLKAANKRLTKLEGELKEKAQREAA